MKRFSFSTFTKKKSAFTLIELLIAMTMMAVLILVISTTISQIYFQQKKITLRQNFHNESRFLMEKIVQLVRNNTIDYDTYFAEEGPFSCTGFQFNTTSSPTLNRIPAALQNPACIILPSSPTPNTNTCPDGYLYDIDSGDNEIDNDIVGSSDDKFHNSHNRKTLGYENLFYFDTDNDNIPDRQLGGRLPNGGIDPFCLETFNPYTNDLTDLYLVNGSRTIRTHIQYVGDGGGDSDGDGENCDTNECIIQLERSLGRDLNGDKKADTWSPVCDNTTLGVPGNDISTQEGQRYCQQGHSLINITPDFLLINNLTFAPGPNKDPYLASRIDSVQVQPHSYIDMSLSLKNPEKARFGGEGPNTRLQTTASSRVFGDTRN